MEGKASALSFVLLLKKEKSRGFLSIFGVIYKSTSFH